MRKALQALLCVLQVDGQNWRQALLDMFTGRYLWRVGCAVYESCRDSHELDPGEREWCGAHAAAVKAA